MPLKPGRFVEYGAAGFLPYVMPAIPPDAVLGDGSTLEKSQCGKVPGVYDDVMGTWCGMSGWPDRVTTPDDIASWDEQFRSTPANIAMRCGKILALDIDATTAPIAEAVEELAFELLGPAPVRGRPNSPKRLLVYRLADGDTAPGKSRVAFRSPDADPSSKPEAVEQLGRGQQFIAEGAHPSSVLYRWRDDFDLTWLGADMLTSVTAEKWRDFLGRVARHLERQLGCTIAGSSTQSAGGQRREIGDASLMASNLSELAAALRAIPCEDLGYDEWIAILHAAKAGAGGDDGFFSDVVLPWALAYPDNDTDVIRAKWDSVTASTIGADYLYGLARFYGFVGGVDEFEPVGAALSDADLIETLRNSGPTVHLGARDDVRVETAERALAHSRQGIYQHGNALVRAGFSDRKIWDGTIVKFRCVEPLTPATLHTALARGVRFVKRQKPVGRPKKTKDEAAGDGQTEARDTEEATLAETSGPTEAFTRLVLGQNNWHHMPKLEGIVTHPVMMRDGRLFDEPGQLTPTDHLYLPYQNHFLPVTDHPTKQDALDALNVLLTPIRLMPYAKDGGDDADLPIRDTMTGEPLPNGRSTSRSVALSALLSPAIRLAVPIIPGFVFTAPRPGEAKSTHADIIGQEMEGKSAPISTSGKNEEEFTKQLKTELKGSSALINFNNLTVPLGANDLLNAATLDAREGQLKFREFGKLTNNMASGYRIFLFNGVKVSILDDMKRRTLRCEIDSQCAQPSRIKYPFNPRKVAHEMRAELLHAALTILRWHFNNGAPPVPGRAPLDGYEEWDAWVAGALVALGEPDPVLSQDVTEDVDTTGNGTARFFTAWAATIGVGKLVGAQEIINATNSDTIDDSPLAHALSDLMEEGKRAHSGLTRQWLGKWLSAHKGDVAGGFRLSGVFNKHTKAWDWRVTAAKGA